MDKNKLKIAQVVCAFPPYNSGIGNIAYEYANRLSKSGHKVTVFTPQYRMVKKKNNFNFKFQYLRPWLKYGNGAFVPGLIKQLKNFQIVHLHYPFFGGAEMVWLAKIFFSAKFKLIIHYHMDVVSSSLFFKILSLPDKLIKRLLFIQASAITVASFDYLENSQIKQFLSKKRKKFYELPFGVDLTCFKPQKNKNNKRKKLLFVGGLDKAHYFKGVDILIQSVADLADRDDWRLSIVGEGNLLNFYIELAKKLKVRNKINFLSKVNNSKLQEIYRESDILIAPSINKNEAFGVVLLEAMASGLAVIASDLPGVRTVFKSGIHGELVRPNDAQDLSNKILKMLNNPEKIKIMGIASRVYCEKNYNWNVIIKKLINIYNK